MIELRTARHIRPLRAAVNVPTVIVAGARASGRATLVARLSDVYSPDHVPRFNLSVLDEAPSADVALIVIDARQGAQPADLQAIHVGHLAGASSIVVAVNKMDLVGNDYGVYRDIVRRCAEWSEKLHIDGVRFVPLSARRGDNVARPSADLDWYDGPTLVAVLRGVQLPANESVYAS